MFPAATLFLDVCVQRDFWPAGAWPLVMGEAADNVARLLRLAAATEVRRGGVVCRHGARDDPAAAAGTPIHCRTPESRARPVGCELLPDEDATGVASGCGQRLDEAPHGPDFHRLVAGVRDAVVFGAGLEYGVAQAVDALLRRRVRTHLVLDAVGAASEVDAQLLVAGWKRRGVDVVTAQVVARLLTLG